MLKETEDFLRSIKAGQQQTRKRKLRTWFIKNKKRIKYSLLFVFIFLCLFFPAFIGGIIGTWIVNFVGTAVKIIGAGF